MVRACRWKTPRSTASASNTNAMNAVQRIGEIVENMLLTQRLSWITSLRNRPAQLDCMFLKPVQQAPCPNKLGCQDDEAEADSQPARTGEDKHRCPYHKKGETEDDLEKTLSSLHRLRQRPMLTTETEVVLHYRCTPFPAEQSCWWTLRESSRPAGAGLEPTGCR